jgi:hypothetical protein
MGGKNSDDNSDASSSSHFYVEIAYVKPGNTKDPKDEKIFCIGSEFHLITKKLTDHPDTIGSDPETHRQVMEFFTLGLTCDPGDDDGQSHCWRNHYHSEKFPFQAPAYIFTEPE